MTKWELDEVLSALEVTSEYLAYTDPQAKVSQQIERARLIVLRAEPTEPSPLHRTADLLLKMCELSLDIFDRLEPALETESAKLQLKTLAGTMRKTIALAKGEHLTPIPGDKQ